MKINANTEKNNASFACKSSIYIATKSIKKNANQGLSHARIAKLLLTLQSIITMIVYRNLYRRTYSIKKYAKLMPRRLKNKHSKSKH